MEKKSKPKIQDPILKGYKRLRKRYIPPLLQLPGITETNFVNDCLPDVVWMSLLNKEFGVREGTELVLDLAERAHSVHRSPDRAFLNFALCNSYAALSDDESARLTRDLADSGTLSKYQQALAPLLALHPACPMRLAEFVTGMDQDSWVRKLGEAVFAIYDKRSTEASVLCANIVVVRGMTGGMFFPKDFDVPDFEALITSPDSEEAQRAASFARAAAMNEMMPERSASDASWCKAFWNRNATIDECLFWVKEGEDPDDVESV